MKRLRVERWSGQLLSPRTRPCLLQQQRQAQNVALRRYQSTSATMDLTLEDESPEGAIPSSQIRPVRQQNSEINSQSSRNQASSRTHSAKLAALHARLALPSKLPLQTLARALVDPTADQNSIRNNASLAQVGSPLLSYHVSEWLLCHYPRLPMTVLFAAAYAYNGPKTLQIIAKEWGVETAYEPGRDVDPGLLQFARLLPGATVPNLAQGGSNRPGLAQFRRGISSRNVYDDEFGDLVSKEGTQVQEVPSETAYSNFVKALVGAVYLHAGRAAAKSFVRQHVLSRHLQISTLFRFDNPVRELSRLCAREDFQYPVARILSETGRRSRTPVFVVGIFSGTEKLGEGSGPSLIEARMRASIAALKAWYLYSPGNDVRVPSDMEEAGAKPWEPVHIDLGEIIH
jgi:dsRNA-specific ribonuclease